MLNLQLVSFSKLSLSQWLLNTMSLKSNWEVFTSRWCKRLSEMKVKLLQVSEWHNRIHLHSTIRKMASYFDEHDCEPLKEGEQPNHLLHMARYVDAACIVNGSYHCQLLVWYQHYSVLHRKPGMCVKTLLQNISTKSEKKVY